ncbi:MAG TPA: LacI family DNA-binding transcriptional regulator [Abditibacteriaceae bacterium]
MTLNSVAPARGGKVTISDVARAAGVSTTAVSYAINGKGRIPDATRQAVLETAQRLGYEANYYAQRIKGGCSNTVACFASEIAGVASEKLGRLQQQLIQRGFSAPLHGLGYASPEEHAEAIKQLRRQRPSAIVCGGVLPDDVIAELRRFRDDGGVVVCYDQTYPLDIEQVTLDREASAYQVTRHLIENGHRDIGISTHSCEANEVPQTRGFRRALSEAGVMFQDDWFCPFYPFELAGKALATHFLAMSKRPTALYIVDDRVATTFVNYILRAGLQVPRDVSVVTHDQASVAEHCLVPLTVVTHPVTRVVSEVVAMVISRLVENYQDEPRHVMVCGQLIERDSVRCLL